MRGVRRESQSGSEARQTLKLVLASLGDRPEPCVFRNASSFCHPVAAQGIVRSDGGERCEHRDSGGKLSSGRLRKGSVPWFNFLRRSGPRKRH